MKPVLTYYAPYTVKRSQRQPNWFQRLIGDGLFDICYDDRPMFRDISSQQDAEYVAAMMNIAYNVGNLDGQTTAYLSQIHELEEYERQCG